MCRGRACACGWGRKGMGLGRSIALLGTSLWACVTVSSPAPALLRGSEYPVWWVPVDATSGAHSRVVLLRGSMVLVDCRVCGHSPPRICQAPEQIPRRPESRDLRQHSQFRGQPGASGSGLETAPWLCAFRLFSSINEVFPQPLFLLCHLHSSHCPG